MDSEKKYKEALERARKIHNQTGFDYEKGLIEEIFPELRESEDERVRKEIINYFRCQSRDEPSRKDIHSKWIAWLEKQGEQKPTEWHREDEQNLNACLGFIPDEYLRRWLKDVIHVKYDMTDDKVEPKFNVGDWCIDEEDGTIFQIVKVLNNTYTYRTNEGDEYSCTHYSLENDARHWTILDAKDGDVLYSLDSNRPFIYKERNGYEQATAYCGLNIYGNFFVWNTKDCIITTDKYIPATKEERELLFSRMKEAGYEWDAEKKELKKVEQEYHCKGVREPKEATGVLKQLIDEQNPTCSEEALQYLRENHSSSEMSDFQAAMNIAVANAYDKGKVDAINTMKTEWSEEDERILNSIIEDVMPYGECPDYPSDKEREYFDEGNRKVDWLKSLKDKYTWKPSEKQMNALDSTLQYGKVSRFQSEQLNSLYNDLKKLRGE